MEEFMPQDNAARADEGEEGQRSNRRPKDTVRHGNVELAIWENQGTGGTFYTTSVPSVRYKDQQSGEWKDGNSFGRHDLLDLAEAAREAAMKIRDLQKGKGQAR
jgi:hypothetical protein